MSLSRLSERLQLNDVEFRYYLWRWCRQEVFGLRNQQSQGWNHFGQVHSEALANLQLGLQDVRSEEHLPVSR